MRDPNFTKKNEPVKQPSSLHLPVVIFNGILLIWVILVIVGYNKFLSAGLAFGLLGGLYVLYFCFSCCCSDIKDYVHNMKPFDSYQ